MATMETTSSFASTEPSSSYFDDTSPYNSTGTNASTTVLTATELPFVIEIFAPLLLLELITVVTCNLVLMALVIKARKVNNNTNIYLFSLSLSSLLFSVNLFSLMATVFARQWILGHDFCYINNFIYNISFTTILPIHTLISRERYKVIKDPLKYSKASTKKAYISNAIIWSFSSVISLTSVLWYAVRYPLSDAHQMSGIECYFVLHLIKSEHTISLVEVLVISLFSGLWLISFSIFTMSHYVMVLRELHRLSKLRTEARILSDSNVLMINQHDKPLQYTAEERAAKSLAFMFVFEFICSFTSLLIFSALSLMGLVSNSNKNPSAAAIIASLSISMLPGINPLILFISNKRFRKRIKGLLKCELTPEFEETTDHYHHLDEADTIHLPSAAAPGVVGNAQTTRRRRSLFIINKSKDVNVENQLQARAPCSTDPELSNANQEEPKDASELIDKEQDVTTSPKTLAQRNASIATIGAIDVKISDEGCAASHDKDGTKFNVSDIFGSLDQDS